MCIPNMDLNALSIPHVETLSTPHIYKRLLSICQVDNFFTCDLEKTFISILGLEKLSILCIDNTYTYDIDKTKIST